MSQMSTTSPVAWIVSEDSVLISRVQSLLKTLFQEVKSVEIDRFDGEEFWCPRPESPELILLDIAQRIDWGLTAIQKIKQARINSPIVVVSDDFSHEFGAKILSQGIKYYLSHDFSSQELRDLAECLIHKQSPRKA